MKNKILPLAAALCLLAQFVTGQNSTVSFDLSQLQNNAVSDTISGSDSSTNLTVAKDNAFNIVIQNTFHGLQIFSGYGIDNVYAYTFSETVTIKSYTTGTDGPDIDFTGTEKFSFRINSGAITTQDVPDNIASSTTYSFENELTITKGSTLYIGSQGDAGQRYLAWRTLTVTAVPEPATYALALAAFAFLFVVHRRRRR